MEFLQPANWPRPKGYASGVAAKGKMVFVSGMIGWDAEGVFRAPDLAGQVRQALANIVTVLEAAGAEASHLVRLTWFITDREAYLRDRKAIGAAYREVVGRHFPPMSVIVVAGLLEPGATVEIEATAVIPARTSVNSTGA